MQHVDSGKYCFLTVRASDLTEIMLNFDPKYLRPVENSKQGATVKMGYIYWRKGYCMPPSGAVRGICLVYPLPGLGLGLRYGLGVRFAQLNYRTGAA
jgi:hypothetical protein